MYRCTNSFIKGEPKDPPHVKAILLALLSCLVFIGLITAVSWAGARKRSQRAHKRAYAPPSLPVEVPAVPDLPPRPLDLNARFRVVPDNFKGISFTTRSYGNYQFSNGKNRDLVLIDGQFREYGESSHYFDLNDVFYTDLTGDGSPEAIAMLTHLECDRSCDGGKNLIYVYSQNFVYSENFPLQEILKYESGSGLQGCSLKSLTVKNRRLTLELFGHCPQPAETSGEYVRRETYDVTRLEFFFNGKQLVLKKKELLTLRDTNEVTHGVEIRINDERTPLANNL